MYYTNSAVRAEPKAALKGGDEWVDFKIASIEKVSHNVKRYIFELPEKDQVLGLTTASAVLAKYINKNGKPVIRPYTPTTTDDTQGEFELVVKKYDTGLFTNYLDSLKPGDSVSFKGPILKYKWETNKHDQIALLGAGTGINPLFQLLQKIALDPKDKTKVTLLYGNITEDDILLRKEIDHLVSLKPGQLKVTYFLDKPPTGWKGETGFITRDYLKKNIFNPTEGDVRVFVCGPPPFYAAISGNKVSPQDQGELTGFLKDLGFAKDQVFKF